MLSFSSQQRYFLYGAPTDMRKGFSGLTGILRQYMLDQKVMSGDVFIFINRRGDRIKLLMWDKTGFVLYYKQLECGTFARPKGQGSTIQLSWKELFMLLEGLEKKVINQRKRYTRRA
jgi:transposase